MMTRKLYALLVGIDRYPPSVPPLNGCVNDVMALESYLRSHWMGEDGQLHLRILKDREATRQAIIDGFRQHLCQAGSDDLAFFHYSGHGSQENTPPELWHLEPDRLNETLVCWDSRTPESWDLCDKELAKLIAEVARKNPHFTVILDCCHSGTGTRDPSLELAVRGIPLDPRQRPLDSYIFHLEELPSRDPIGHSMKGRLFQGRHILLAACRDSEEAKEYRVAGETRGVLCFFLLETLKRANGNLTYRDLFKRLKSIIQDKVTDQTPQLEVTELRDRDRLFLGGAIVKHDPYFTVSYSQKYGWIVDGGIVQGIRADDRTRTTQLALFPFERSSAQLQNSQSIGTAEVIAVFPHLSQIQIMGIVPLNTDMTFKAAIVCWPRPALSVYLTGDSTGVSLLREALLTGQSSIYVRETGDSAQATLKVSARGNQYQITRMADGDFPIGVSEDFTLESAAAIVRGLEGIARWTAIAELASPSDSHLDPNAVRLEIYQDERLLDGTEPIRLEYQLDRSLQWQPPAIYIKLTNASHIPLYCALLNLTDRHAVRTDFFASGGIWLNPGEEAWTLQKQPLYVQIPQERLQHTQPKVLDILKLIVSTAEFDITLLEQDRLDAPEVPSPVDRGLRTPSFLNGLVNRMPTRDFVFKTGTEELDEGWMTSQVAITTVGPSQPTSMPPILPSVPPSSPKTPSLSSLRQCRSSYIKTVALLSSTVALILGLMLWRHSVPNPQPNSGQPSSQH